MPPRARAPPRAGARGVVAAAIAATLSPLARRPATARTRQASAAAASAAAPAPAQSTRLATPGRSRGGGRGLLSLPRRPRLGRRRVEVGLDPHVDLPEV